MEPRTGSPRAEIEDLYGRYVHALRRSDASILVGCFAEDAVFDLEHVGVFTGRSEIRGLFEKMAADRPLHLVTDLFVSGMEQNSARCEAHLLLISCSTGELLAAGRYEDRLARHWDGSWLWTSRSVRYLWRSDAYASRDAH